MKPISYGQYTTPPLQKSSSLHKFPKKWSKNVQPKNWNPFQKAVFLRQGFAGGKPPFSMLFFAFCHKRLTFKRREGCCPLFEVNLSYLFDKLEVVGAVFSFTNERIVCLWHIVRNKPQNFHM